MIPKQIFLILLCLHSLPGALSANEKPNFLFIFADDHCHDLIGAYGAEVHTPNLDRLVESGVSFSNAYSMGSWTPAVCAASRTMLNTGRSVWRANQLNTHLADDVENENFWSQMLANAGYRTYMTGKWHVSVAAQEVFQTTADIRGGMPNQVEAGYNRPIDPESYQQGWKPWDPSHGGFWQGGKHWSEIVGDHGVAFLDQASREDQPFFMYLAFNAPHDPRQSPKRYVDLYPLDAITIPSNFLPEYPYNEAMGSGRSLRDERLAPFPRTAYSVRVNRQEYYAIITHMDDQIGRILDALEASGKADKTYIFFTADHGLAVGHHGLLGKQNMFEHSMKPPLIVTGPDVPSQKIIETPVYYQDIMATTLDLAEVEKKDHIEFKSLMPLILNETQQQYRSIYGAYLDTQRMLRQGKYKLIHYPIVDKQLLFNLEDDPSETVNLATNPEYQSVVKQMSAELRRLEVELSEGGKIEGKYFYRPLNSSQ